MLLILAVAYSYLVFLDSLTNKSIRIVPSEMPNAFLSELNSSFGENPFRVINESSVTPEYSIGARINRDGPLFKVRIGGSELCRKKNKLVKCEDKVDFWEITRNGSRFMISQKGYCLSVVNEGSVLLERCNGFGKNHLFSFKDAEFETCLESLDLNSRPKTKVEMLEQLKLRDKLAKLDDRKEANRLREKLEEKNDFDKFMEKRLAKVKEKEKMNKLMEKMWKYDWKRPKFSLWGYKFPDWNFPFCRKLW